MKSLCNKAIYNYELKYVISFRYLHCQITANLTSQTFLNIELIIHCPQKSDSIESRFIISSVFNEEENQPRLKPQRFAAVLQLFQLLHYDWVVR